MISLTLQTRSNAVAASTCPILLISLFPGTVRSSRRLANAREVKTTRVGSVYVRLTCVLSCLLSHFLVFETTSIVGAVDAWRRPKEEDPIVAGIYGNVTGNVH